MLVPFDDFLPMPSLLTTPSAHWTRLSASGSGAVELGSARKRSVPEGGICMCLDAAPCSPELDAVIVCDPEVAGVVATRGPPVLCAAGMVGQVAVVLVGPFTRGRYTVGIPTR